MHSDPLLTPDSSLLTGNSVTMSSPIQPTPAPAPRVASVDAYRGLVSSYRQAGRGEDAARAAGAARERFPDDPSFTP